MGFRWGIQWGKFGSGAALFLIGGGISAALWFGMHAINLWAAAATVIGACMMFMGLLGEDGVW